MMSCVVVVAFDFNEVEGDGDSDEERRAGLMTFRTKLLTRTISTGVFERGGVKGDEADGRCELIVLMVVASRRLVWDWISNAIVRSLNAWMQIRVQWSDEDTCKICEGNL
jgi:hypothetical protein